MFVGKVGVRPVRFSIFSSVRFRAVD